MCVPIHQYLMYELEAKGFLFIGPPVIMESAHGEIPAGARVRPIAFEFRFVQDHDRFLGSASTLHFMPVHSSQRIAKEASLFPIADATRGIPDSCWSTWSFSPSSAEGWGGVDAESDVVIDIQVMPEKPGGARSRPGEPKKD